jgi:DNA-binding MarR family transcriptional regulator
MAHRKPLLRVALRGELLGLIAQRFPGVDPLLLQLLNSIRSVSQSLSDSVEEVLDGFQLTEGKFFVIAYLLIEELRGHACPSPSDIADNLGVTRATTTGLLDGLERNGLIERRSDASDRRMISVAITDEARLLLDKLAPSILSTSGPMIVDALDSDERTTLLALLTKMELKARRA